MKINNRGDIIYNQPHLTRYELIIADEISISANLIAFPDWELHEQWLEEHGCEGYICYDYDSIRDDAMVVSQNMVDIL